MPSMSTADGIFGKLPKMPITERLNAAGIPATMSSTTGTHICKHSAEQTRLARTTATRPASDRVATDRPAADRVAADSDGR